MSIHVVCTACHASFNVSDKFAGKTGPCPKCKKTIQVPEKSEEITVHEGHSEAGAKDSKGRSVLKPIVRTEVKLNPIILGICGAVALVVMIVAWSIGASVESPENIPTWLMAVGAFAIAPPLVFLGYSVLREPETEPFRGAALWIRVAAVSLIYVAIWGFFVLLGNEFLEEMWLKVGYLVFVSIFGAITALVAFELDFSSGLFHYLLYLGVCLVLRLLLGLPFI